MKIFVSFIVNSLSQFVAFEKPPPASHTVSYTVSLLFSPINLYPESHPTVTVSPYLPNKSVMFVFSNASDRKQMIAVIGNNKVKFDNETGFELEYTVYVSK